MQYRQLGNTGLNVSVLSYGASPLGNAFRTIDDNDGIRTLRTALDLGINFLDTSPHYGATKSDAIAKAEALALRVLAERIEHNESGPLGLRIVIAAE